MMTDRVIFVCTIIIAAVYFYATTLIPSLEIGDPLGPKAFPRLLGICLLIAAGLLFLEMWKDRKLRAPQTDSDEPVVWQHLMGHRQRGGLDRDLLRWRSNRLGYIVATSVYLLGVDGVVQPRQVDRQRIDLGAVLRPELL